MSSWRDDPDEVARAKGLASGDLGRELVRFSLQFAQPVLFGNPPMPGVEPLVNNGTATLLRLDRGELAVTCEHVLAGYASRKAQDRSLVFQVGMLEFDPLDRMIDRDATLDIVTFDLSGLDHRRASVRGGPMLFHEPVDWPPGRLVEGDVVSLGGFPGDWRQPAVNAWIDFDTFSVGITPVTRVSPDRVVCQFEREYWVQSYGTRGMEFKALGGMSGAPVMVLRKLHFELAGIVSQFSGEFDLLYVAPASRLRRDGTIIRNDEHARTT